MDSVASVKGVVTGGVESTGNVIVNDSAVGPEEASMLPDNFAGIAFLPESAAT